MAGFGNQPYSFGTAFRMQPSAIRNIIIISVISFIIQLIFPAYTTYLAYIPDWWTALTQPWRIVTYLFLHNNVWHILFNMLWLFWMGKAIEMEVGSRTFSSLYFLSGMGGALVNLFPAGAFGANPVIGASGAVYGVMVAFAVFHPNAPIMLFLLPPLPAKYVIGGLILIDVILIGDKSATARLVHVGGALTGYVLSRAMLKGTSISGWIDFIMFYVHRFTQSAKKLNLNLKSLSQSQRKASRPRNSKMRAVQDVEILEEIDQNELDRILDKIAKSGYDALSAEEKRILFEMSKRR